MSCWLLREHCELSMVSNIHKCLKDVRKES